MLPFRLVSEPEAPPADLQFIRDAVDEYNMVKMNDHDYRAVNIFVRDDAGEIAGGILGGMWGGWLHIIHLWVAPELRMRGFGSALLNAAEDEGRANGCRAAFLETHTFQSPEFYQRHGFQPIGELKDYPPGHSYFIMTKNL